MQTFQLTRRRSEGKGEREEGGRKRERERERVRKEEGGKEKGTFSWESFMRT